MKIRVGIFFGGSSREREISFAGGRTVYDNLNKTLFEPVPIFVDSFDNFVHLNWQYIYKGSIRDFYPPVQFIPSSPSNFQIYAESLGPLSISEQHKLLEPLGQVLTPDQIAEKIDIAFLCLHGTNGEDGRLQGLLEYLNIPYTGSGILPSAIGMNKAIQKEIMRNAGFKSPAFQTIERETWLNQREAVKQQLAVPLVIKPANQGSSIGVSIVTDPANYNSAVDKAFFCRHLQTTQWQAFTTDQKIEYVKNIADIREGLGMPLQVTVYEANQHAPHKTVQCYHPDKLIELLNTTLINKVAVKLEAIDAESTVLIEGFITGKEFSCIVIQNQQNQPIALPPTEIRKASELFDYRSKYLPGLSRKITPIDLPEQQIAEIRKQCESLFQQIHFDVYARIDGFINTEGEVFLNDPNTTSGMMPSSFFFHQAAEIGLNPSQFLTYIIRTSLQRRQIAMKNKQSLQQLINTLDQNILHDQQATANKIKVAVIFGGYSSERHISVESGRNIYEKLASSSKYAPIPVFLTGDQHNHQLYKVPINLLLKDNADDIKEKIQHYTIHPQIKHIISQCEAITSKYTMADNLGTPQPLTYHQLAQIADCAFIALHGRPGEDGAVQSQLEQVGLPYNGSGVESSKLTIDKFKTNETLRQNGFLVANHLLVTENQWNTNPEQIISKIKADIQFPFIAKPVDDGCSSAVRKIKSEADFKAYCALIFRKQSNLDAKAAEQLHVLPNEEFPQKNVLLVESLITRQNASHFLEITGGMVTKFDNNGNIQYDVFEASEALSEGEVLSLEEKFLAGQGQNITPARYAPESEIRQKISDKVKHTLGQAAQLLKVKGYTRIDAFVRIYNPDKIEVVFIEVNSLPGMTPATCIFHQSALYGYKPYDLIDHILQFAFEQKKRQLANLA